MSKHVLHSIICPIYVGRAAQRAALQKLLEQTQREQGQIALIAGEAGIGKSRLITEIKTEVMNLGFAVLQGACFAQDSALPYAPLLDLLRSFCATYPRTILAERLFPYADGLGKLSSELAVLWPDLAPPAPKEPEVEKRQLFGSLSRFFTDFTRPLPSSVEGTPQSDPSPLLIIIEDIHWCDDSSLEFLLYLMHAINEHPILILLTMRDEESTTQLRQFLAALDRSRRLTELTLPRLSSDDTELMIRTIFGQPQPVRQEFVEEIYRLTEGNPFFIEETLKSLVIEGDIFYADGQWTRKIIRELRIPRSVQVAVIQQTRQLSQEARHLLTLATIVGRRFDFSLLQAVTGSDEETLVALLKELLRAQLVSEASAETFSFRHALTQQAIYNNLLYRERIPLHRAVAEQIEQVYANNLEPRLADLAFHYHAGQQWLPAIDYARRAGDRAQTLFAPRAAVEHFTRAIDAAGHLSDISSLQSSRLYRARGQAHEQLGDFDAALGDYEAALAGARSADDQESIWQGLVDLSFLWAQRDYVKSGRYLEQALSIAFAIKHASHLAHTYKRLGNWHMNVDHLDVAVQHLEQALGIFESLEDKRGIAETLDLLGICSFARSNAIDGCAFYERALKLFRALGDTAGELNSLLIYAPRHCVYINNAATWPAVSLAERLQDGAAASTLAAKLGAKPAEIIGQIWSANTWGIGGQYERALAQAKTGLALAEETEHRHFTATGHMVLGAICWDMLLFDEAQYHLQRALAITQESTSLIWLGCIVGLLVSTLVQQQDLAQAERVLHEMWRADLPMQSHGERQLWCAYAEFVLTQRNPEQALSIVEQLIASDPHTSTLGQHAIPRLAHLRADALMHLGRYPEAESALFAAQHFVQDAPSFQWRLYLMLGHLYRRQNRRDDADRAYGEARHILADLAANIDDHPLRDHFTVQTERQFPQSTEKQLEKQHFAGLTARERQVAGLIAQGKSNKEIAASFVLSHRTVETHVSNILSKLSFTSRAQVAVWAMENGLDGV